MLEFQQLKSPLKNWKNKFLLAPLAGITDAPFRFLCKEYSCAYSFVPLVSSEAVIRGKMNPEIWDKEKPVGVQLFGSDPMVMAKAAGLLQGDSIDINMGCPERIIMQSGGGGILIRNPDRAFDIVKAVRKSWKGLLTVKTRIGFSSFNPNDFISFCRGIENAGADAIIIHGRTVKQGYGGKANWDAIKLAVNKLNIPVIGNGDVYSLIDGRRMISETGCFAVMIGRGAVGNPFIFSGENITKEKKISALRRYIELSKDKSFGYIKKQSLFFLSDFPGSREMRRKITTMKTFDELFDFISEETTFYSQT